MNQAVTRASLFAPEEIAALFDCAAGELAFSLDNLRYLGFILPVSGPGHTGQQ